MWQYNNLDELYHYGILGMKWHVHKVNRALNEYKKSANSIKAYDKYNKYKKVVDNEIKSLKKNNMKLLYDFNKDKYYAVKNKKNIKKSKSNTSSKKKLVTMGAVAATTVLAAYGANKLLDMREKARIAKQYPIEKINGLGLDADYARHYMKNFKRVHGGG